MAGGVDQGTWGSLFEPGRSGGCSGEVEITALGTYGVVIVQPIVVVAFRPY